MTVTTRTWVATTSSAATPTALASEPLPNSRPSATASPSNHLPPNTPGIHLSAATVEKASPLPPVPATAGRGHREFPWLGGLWRPAVQRLSNTQVQSRIYARIQNKRFRLLMNETTFGPSVLLRTSAYKSTQNYHQLHN